jgi:16S rRNA G966 N2-methylase RsmD
MNTKLETKVLKLSEIKFNEEYQGLIPAISSAEYNTINDSISKQGSVKIPIELNEKLEVLDGHNRTQISIELGFDVILAHIHNFKGDSLAEKEFIIICNLNRRQLNPFQRIELVTKMEPIQAELARARQRAGKTSTLVQNCTKVKGRVIDILARQAHVSPMTYLKGREILQKAPNEDIQKLRNNHTKIDKVHKTLKNEEKRQHLILQTQNLRGKFLPSSCKLHHGDFREKCTQLTDQSVDLIFTDPPYAREFLPLYSDLANVAAWVLKHDGSIVTYCGQDLKLRVIEFMQYAGLTHWWEIAVIHSGPYSSFFLKNILVKWKPLLWFVKGEKPHQNGKVFDLIDSIKPAKALHSYEQSSEDARYIIEQLTKPGGIVCDPFMGSGTTGIAALKFNRQFIGIEIDKDIFDIANVNIAGALQQEITS